jgi:hypothetical protein
MLSHRPRVLCCLLTALILWTGGCTTAKPANTTRTATEQLLVSNAVDQSLNKIDFTPLSGARVFVEEKYIDCIDKGYIIGSIRHKLLQAGAMLAAKPEEAEAIMEVRSGAVGTDVSGSYVGIPGFTAPGMPVGIPDIKLATRDSQNALAKIGIVVYGVKSRKELGEGGISLAKAEDTKTYFMGIGPHRSGTLQREVKRMAPVRPDQYVREIPTEVALSQPTSESDKSDEPSVTVSSAEKKKDEKKE